MPELLAPTSCFVRARQQLPTFARTSRLIAAMRSLGQAVSPLGLPSHGPDRFPYLAWVFPSVGFHATAHVHRKGMQAPNRIRNVFGAKTSGQDIATVGFVQQRPVERLPTALSVVEQHRKNEVRTLQEAIEQYQSQRGKYEGMKATAVETIAGREKPDVGILQNTMAAAEEQLKSADTAYSRCQQMCMVDERIYEALSPKMAQHIDLARQFAEIDGLYRRLSGNQSGAHMDIETFVQRQYLQSILNAANQRFRQMSSNEFELRMIDDEHAGEGRTNQGLDLMVYSYATSETRRVETLSGGETFMAALSLALGMADQIQATSGSIHLDMMFIDEGFGSLDDHSRDNAIDVLKKMAGGSKLIGIISHVSELQQQIEDQLVVTRDVHTGSHARWIIS